MYDALHYLLDNIPTRYGSKLYRQIVGIPMGTNGSSCCRFAFFLYERDFMNMLTDGQTPAISSHMRAKMRQIDRSGTLCRSRMSQIADSSDVAILYIVFLYDGNIMCHVTLCTTHVNESPNGTCLPTFMKKG